MSQVSRIELTALRDIVRGHKKHAGKANDWKTIDLSIDGVPKAKSGSNDLVVISVSFVGCGKPFPLQIIRRKIGEEILTPRDIADMVIDDILAAQLDLRYVVCDSKERKKLLGLTGGAGYYGCEYCHIRGKYSRQTRRMNFPYRLASNGGSTEQTTNKIYLQIQALPCPDEAHDGEVRGASAPQRAQGQAGG